MSTPRCGCPEAPLLPVVDVDATLRLPVVDVDATLPLPVVDVDVAVALPLPLVAALEPPLAPLETLDSPPLAWLLRLAIKVAIVCAKVCTAWLACGDALALPTPPVAVVLEDAPTFALEEPPSADDRF